MNATTVYRYLDKLCAEHTVIKYPDLNSDKAVFQFAGEEKKCAVEICFMESARTVKKKKILLHRSDCFSSGPVRCICRIIHLIDTGTVIRQATAPDSMTATSWNRNWELRMISRVYCCV